VPLSAFLSVGIRPKDRRVTARAAE
jgi:hypothetical protein